MKNAVRVPAPVPRYTLQYRARGRWWWYWIWPVYGSVVVAVAVALVTHTPDDSFQVVFLPALLAGVVLSLWGYWAAEPALVLLEDRLIYRKRQVLYAAIRRVKVVIETRQAGVGIAAVAFMRITQRGGEVLRIPMRLFRRSDMAILVDVIANRAPDARLDHYAELVRAGRFFPRDHS
jgi:hypothetical protein